MSGRFALLLILGSAIAACAVAQAANRQSQEDFASEAGTVHIAVVTDFKPTLEALLALYAQPSITSDVGLRSTRFIVKAGTSGALHEAIRAGAAVDLVFSADAAGLAALEHAGLLTPGTLLPYAVGRLVLWTPGRPVAGTLEATLHESAVHTLALADPAVDPYGAAAAAALRQLHLRRAIRIERGARLEEVFDALTTGEADAGFLARAQVRAHERAIGHSLAAELLSVEPESTAALEQHMALTRPAATHRAARDFWAFVQNEPAQRLITAAGYQSPSWTPPDCRGCQREAR